MQPAKRFLPVMHNLAASLGTIALSLAALGPCTAQFMIVFDFQMVSLALPVIQRGLRVSPATVQWVGSLYALAFGCFLLLAGRISDLLGAKRTFGLGLGLFMFGAVGCGVAVDEVMLITMRGVQGLGAALMVPSAMAILLGTFPRARNGIPRLPAGQQPRRSAAF
jgi:MFS family permease